MNRMLQRGLVATIAALAMFPVAAVSADAAVAAPQRHATTHQHVTNQNMTPPQMWTPDRYPVRPATRTGHVNGRVVTRYLPLNVRSGPGTGHWIIGSVRPGNTVHIRCKAVGSNVRGNHRWYRLSHHKGYVSAHYVRNLSAVPWC